MATSTTLQSNDVRTVIVEKLDRLARDLMVQESALSHFSQHGFTIVSVAEPDLCQTILAVLHSGAGWA